jgi:hypothetical protein
MKRTFTKYPSSILASDYQNKEANVWHISFYRMISDLIPLYNVYVEADSKDEAREIGEDLARVLGYNPEKIVVQFAHMSQFQFDEYYVPETTQGISYFVRSRYR